MSVTTSADLARTNAKEKMEEAKKALKEAQESMEEMIDSETWGGDEWNSDFVEKVEAAIQECLKIRSEVRKIKNIL